MPWRRMRLSVLWAFLLRTEASPVERRPGSDCGLSDCIAHAFPRTEYAHFSAQLLGLVTVAAEIDLTHPVIQDAVPESSVGRFDVTFLHVTSVVAPLRPSQSLRRNAAAVLRHALGSRRRVARLIAITSP